MIAGPLHGRSERMQPNEPESDETPDIEIGVEQWFSAPRTAAYYRAAAARARTLEAAVTTPRLRKHLGDMIARYERRAGEVEEAEKDSPEAITRRARTLDGFSRRAKREKAASIRGTKGRN